MEISDGFQERLLARYSARPGVAAKKAFGRDAISVNDKIFAIHRLGTVVLKLPVERGLGLIDAGEASQFEPAPGRHMKEWFVFGPEVDEDRLFELADEGYDFVLGLQA
ncbi:MAG: hypothetical protein QM648_07150 [Solirubrobacterales bacterium]